jgi:hypothetical protein
MSFDDAKSVAHNRHQNALTVAHETFHAEVSDDRDSHRLSYLYAQRDWDSVKSYPLHPDHDRHRAAFTQAQEPPDHKPAHDQLDRAVRAADTALHTELRQIASQHGVTIFTGSTP